MSAVLQVAGGRPLVGTVEVPGDKSISHRALLLGALAEGSSTVRALSKGEDVAHTEAAVTALGATVRHAPTRAGASDEASRRGTETTIQGGVSRLAEPTTQIDCGNSGTTMRLLAGVVASMPWHVTLIGDASLSNRPMDRVAGPLTLMGANVAGTGPRLTPPLVIDGGDLHGIDYSPPQASSQVKSCIMLAGLQASGETVVREVVATRRHTEELLELCAADFEESFSNGSHVVCVRRSVLQPFNLDVPGDPSQAAFWVVAACLVEGSAVRIPGIYVGEGRRGFLDVLARMGANVDELPTARGDGRLSASADLVVRNGPLVATEVDAAEITGLDEVPVLAVAASRAAGTTTFRNVAELRMKESDRLTGVVKLLETFGARADVRGDDLLVHGSARLSGGDFDASGDHRMAMAAAVAALAAEHGATSVITGWDCVSTSYPAFEDDLDNLVGSRR
ncbi:MAG: 3-phosphoshikimate 1-carboxyvinyltransferase [Acidimicrobiales bacterium]